MAVSWASWDKEDGDGLMGGRHDEEEEVAMEAIMVVLVGQIEMRIDRRWPTMRKIE